MHIPEMPTHEMHAHEMHAYKVHAHKTHIYKICAHEMRDAGERGESVRFVVKWELLLLPLSAPLEPAPNRPLKTIQLRPNHQSHSDLETSMATGQVQNPVLRANPITAEATIQAFIPLVTWCKTS